MYSRFWVFVGGRGRERLLGWVSRLANTTFSAGRYHMRQVGHPGFYNWRLHARDACTTLPCHGLGWLWAINGDMLRDLAGEIRYLGGVDLQTVMQPDMQGSSAFVQRQKKRYRTSRKAGCIIIIHPFVIFSLKITGLFSSRRVDSRSKVPHPLCTFLLLTWIRSKRRLKILRSFEKVSKKHSNYRR